MPQETTKEKNREEEIKVLKNILELAKLQGDILKANIAPSENKGLKGKVEIKDGAGYYAEILAYYALDDCAEEIAKSIVNKINNQKTLIILENSDLSEKALLWHSVFTELKLLNDELKTFINNYSAKNSESLKTRSINFPKIATTALGAAPIILGAISNITSFFRTDRTIIKKEVEVKTQSLIAAISKKINTLNNNIKILLPNKNLKFNGKLQTEFTNLIKNKNRLLTLEKNLNKNKLKINSDYLKKTITATETIIEAFTKKTDGEFSLLKSVATIEKIMIQTNPYLLYLSIATKGGEIETSQSAFSQGRVSYLGGIVVSYIMTDIEGNYLDSGNAKGVRSATFKRSKGIVNMKNK